VLADLELACQCGLLEERPTGLAFRHELVREALDAGAGSARRALVHRDVARALAGRAQRDPLEIAVHARLGGETALAAEWFVRAADAAFARFDVGAALDHLQSALDLRPDDNAYAARARVRLSSLDLQGAADDAAEAVRLGGGPAALEISAWVAYYRRRYDEARAFADAGAEQATDPVLEVSCRAVGGRVRHGAGDLAGAVECLEAGIALVGAPGVAGVWLGHAKVHQGRPRDALDVVQRALTDPDHLAHPWAAMHGRFARIMALGQLGRVDDALTACDEMERARLRAGIVGERFVGIADNARGWLLRNVGRIDEADDSNERALAAHSERSALASVGFTEAYWVAMLDLIDGRLLAGDADGARRLLTAAAPLDSWQGTMAWHQRQRLGLLRARLALMTGEDAEAWKLADEVRADAASRGARRYELLAAAWCACSEPDADRERVSTIVDGMQGCAQLEGWRLTAVLAERLGVDEWRGIAERTAGALVANSGPYRDSAATWIDSVLRAPFAS
jgi:tetratricopeptide (TPR) repeat protein